MAASGYVPAPAFSFTVAVAGSGTPLQLSSEADASFQEVSGLDAKFETETIREGGENRFAHVVPSVTKPANLVLRRGYVTAPSFLAEWAAQTVGATLNAPILTQTIVVFLLGPERTPLVAWSFDRAWPLRWETGPFGSQKNEVLTEVLEFSYATVMRIPMNEATAMVPSVAALIG